MSSIIFVAKIAYTELKNTLPKIHENLDLYFNGSNFITSDRVKSGNWIIEFFNSEIDGEKFIDVYGDMLVTSIETGLKKEKKTRFVSLTFSTILRMAMLTNELQSYFGETAVAQVEADYSGLAKIQAEAKKKAEAQHAEAIAKKAEKSS